MNYSLLSSCDSNLFVDDKKRVNEGKYSKPYIQDPTFSIMSMNQSIAEATVGHSVNLTPLAELFFSRMNITHIQKKIKKEVFLRTNGMYILRVDQNELDLIAIMQSVYIDDGENMPFDYKRQLKNLNHKLIERVVPDMITTIKQQNEYLNVISKPRELIPLPVNVNNTGKKGTLPSYTTTYNW